jgi:hypothetical protein
MKVSKLTVERLKAELIKANEARANGTITVENSRGETRTLSFTSVSHTGGFALNKDVEANKPAFLEYLAISTMALSQTQKASSGGHVARSSATHNQKKDVASLSTRIAGLVPKTVPAVIALAQAQAAAKLVKQIENEIADREAIAKKLAKAAAKRAEKAAALKQNAA